MRLNEDALASCGQYPAAEASTTPVSVVRYALARPLPPVTRTLEVGELARRAVLSRYGGPEKRPAPLVLSGRSEERPVATDHCHASYLPMDEDGDGLIDHLAIYSPVGFDDEALATLEDLPGIFPGNGLPGWPVRCLGRSSGEALRMETGVWVPAAVWKSVTPFVLTRYPKQHRDGTPKLTERGEQRDGPEDQARREWQHRRRADPFLPDLIEAVRLPACLIRGRELNWREFHVARRWGEGYGTPFSTGLRLSFSTPVAGPVLLGYGCHFGLGQFRPT